MAHQRGQPFSNFAQIVRETVLTASLLEYSQRGFSPAAALTVPVILYQLMQNTLWTADGVVVLAGGQLVASRSRIKAQRHSLTFQSRRLILALWFKAAYDPAFSFNNCKPDDDRDSTAILTSGLLQPSPPFWFIILVADQHDRI
jgi:hypothetical protein